MLPNPFQKQTGQPTAPSTPQPTPAARPTKQAPVLAPLQVQQLESVLADALAFYRQGTGNGDTTHWPCLDEYWTWLKKEITIITGNANHGKSRFIHAVMLLKAVFSNWRFAVFVPENEEDFYVELAQALVGRTANIKFENNRMSEEQLTAAITWLHERFVVVTAPDGANPQRLLDEFARLHAERPLDGVLIDPWNQLDHDWQSREDIYLSGQFGILKRFAIKHELALLVTAHPAGQSKDKNGNLIRPDAYSISGGKMWNNKFDNVLAVFRPDFPAPELELWIHKIKKRGRVGQPGTVLLRFDLPQSRYFPQIGDQQHPLEKVDFNAPGSVRVDPNAAAAAYEPRKIGVASTFEQEAKPQPDTDKIPF